MALQALASHITYAAQLLQAGDTFDDQGELYAGLVDAGAKLYPADHPLIAAGVEACANLRSKGANETELDSAMAAAVTAYVKATAGGGGYSPGHPILWRADGQGDVASAAELVAMVSSSKAPPEICCDSNFGQLLIPTGSTVDLQHARLVKYQPGANGQFVVAGTLKNVNFLIGVQMLIDPAATSPAFIFEGGNPDVLICMFGGGVTNNNAAPAIVIAPGALLIVGGLLGGGVGSGASPCIEVGSGSFLVGFQIDNTTGNAIGDGTVSSVDNTGILVIGHTGNFTGFPVCPAFTGTMINNPLTQDGGSGPTSARPQSALLPVIPGTFYDNTTLGYVEETFDGGATWQPQSSAPSDVPRTVKFDWDFSETSAESSMVPPLNARILSVYVRVDVACDGGKTLEAGRDGNHSELLAAGDTNLALAAPNVQGGPSLATWSSGTEHFALNFGGPGPFTVGSGSVIITYAATPQI